MTHDAANQMHKQTPMEETDGASIHFDESDEEPVIEHAGDSSDDEAEVDPPLTEHQSKALKKALQGFNIFITGPGGVGKTFVVKKIKKELEARGRHVVVTATTGCAAVAVDGTTIHRFAGFYDIDKNDIAMQIHYNVKDDKIKTKHQKVDTLIIDEVSMMSDRTLMYVDQIFRATRAGMEKPAEHPIDTSPFGGIQVIFVGDFKQLPPIIKRKGRGVSPSVLAREANFDIEDSTWKQIYDRINLAKQERYAFDCKLWEKMVRPNEVVILGESMRQTNLDFFELLKRLSEKKLTKDDYSVLERRCNVTLPVKDGIIPTKLYCRNKDVDSENE